MRERRRRKKGARGADPNSERVNEMKCCVCTADLPKGAKGANMWYCAGQEIACAERAGITSVERAVDLRDKAQEMAKRIDGKTEVLRAEHKAAERRKTYALPEEATAEELRQSAIADEKSVAAFLALDRNVNVGYRWEARAWQYGHIAQALAQRDAKESARALESAQAQE